MLKEVRLLLLGCERYLRVLSPAPDVCTTQTRVGTLPRSGGVYYPARPSLVDLVALPLVPSQELGICGLDKYDRMSEPPVG